MELRTEQFYEPLRNSLEKSIVQPNNIYTNSLSLTKSRINSPYYSLSPEEADYIVELLIIIEKDNLYSS